ncbi:MAG: RagB/SusD family nutrient uptake outer membrane protein [Saprospiraceae bacterium]|nr:RagB/SusD family nutrient uptake outer membrane protein [Saprospiraceae bacterium]
MNIKLYFRSLFILLGMTASFTACFNDLDTTPIDPDSVTAANVYDDPAAYRQVLAKLYAGLAVSGQQGPSGQADIEGIDEGFGQYLRGLWYHQQLPTDEAVIGWNDQTIKDFHEQDWDANDPFIYAFYSRIFYQISVCNEFLRETTEDKLNERGVDDALKTEIQGFRAEARFLRALSYYHALDHFRNVPFVTEEDRVGSFFPEQIQAPQLFDFLITELTEIEGQLPTPKANEYGRADQAAIWMLLAKLYLNAEVYAGKNEYANCLTQIEKVINAGYELDEEYEHLFMADNDLSNEVIFSIPFDGINTKTWGGTTFILRAGIGGSMNDNAPTDYGVADGWGGTRVTSSLVGKYPAVASEQGGGLIVLPNSGEDYTQAYVPGSFVQWNPANAPALTSPNEDDVFEGYIYFEEADQKFIITRQRSFANNFGDDGQDGTLEPNGDQIDVAEPGVYYLNADLTNLTYTLEKVEFGIIGSATANGWDSDIDMVYSPEDTAWVYEGLLSAGEMKFRANDDWAINYGDDGADAILELDGGNIIVESTGNYRVKFFTASADYTYSLELTSSDKRANFYTEGQTLEIADIAQFTEGYASQKYKNVTRDGSRGSDLTHVDIDFPMWRLADAYLMYAEAHLRGGGGDANTAVDYINMVRLRAYGDESGQITTNDLNLDFILDERARELYWEAHRRQDLVRFGQFSDGSYVWPWKGGVVDGAAVEEHFDVYPIPSADIGANPSLTQNTGY